MKCQDFEMLVLALARNRMLDEAACDQGLAHAEVCVRCRTRLVEERIMLAGVRAVVNALAEEEAPARVEAALLTAFRKQATAPPAIIQMPIESSHTTTWQRAAIAAGIVILILVLAISLQRSSSPHQQSETQAESFSPPVTPVPETPKPQKPIIDHDRKVALDTRLRTRHRVSRINSEDAEVVTQFFPLIEGVDLTSLESVRLVRVELPGSALLEVGLPVGLEAVNTPVKADVVLGQDGLARAIRFVR